MEEKYPREKPEENHYHPEETDEEKFEREFYEPATLSRTSNIIGWVIAIVLFIIAIWLLWVALK